MNDSKVLPSSLLEFSTLALAPGEIVLGAFSAIDSAGNPLVSYLHSASSMQVAISTIPVTHQHIGRQVALLFANGDIEKPIIIGFIHSALDQLLDSFELTPAHTNDDADVFENTVESKNLTDSAHSNVDSLDNTNVLNVDGKRIVIEGKEEIVLQCGESSITLTKAGKILIRGKYLVSRSSGVNRILGGSVQVN